MWIRFALLLACVGCGASVQRTLSSLPDDRQDQTDALESAGARPTAESRKPLPRKLQKAETTAATVAAIVGNLLSTSANTVVGIGAPIEIVTEPDLMKRQRPPGEGEGAAEGEGPPPDIDAKQLVPWLKFDPPPPE